MAYTLSIPVILGLGQTGLTLTAALFDTAHSAAAGLTTTTLSETSGAKGSYLWTGTLPDGHRGYIKFSAAGVEKAIAAINPEDVEYSDVKVSTRLAAASYTAPDNATITSIASALTTAAANVATILGKLVGITLLANWLRALARKDTPNATALSELNSGGGTYDATTDALEALRDRGDLAWVSASSTFTLSQVAASVEAALADAGDLTLRQATSWSQTLTGLGNVTARTKLYLTVKHRASDLDSAALIQIEESGGLLVIAGAAAPVSGQGTLSVATPTAAAVTFTLSPKATVLLGPGTYHYDVKMITAAGATLLTTGAFRVDSIYTRAVS